MAARVGRGPNLDGSLGDECYRRAQRISGFSRLRGGAPPTQKTEAYLVWTKTALYIAMKCYEAKPDAMVAIAKEHDSAVAADDSIQLFLDTNHDHKTYYHLVSNFKGVRFDATDPCGLGLVRSPGNRSPKAATALHFPTKRSKRERNCTKP